MKCCLYSEFCSSSCADVICPAFTLLMMTRGACGHTVHAVNTHKQKLNTFQLPRFFIYFLLAQFPRAGKSQRKQSWCCLSWLGASCPDRGTSRDIPERNCWNRGGGTGWLGPLSMTYNLIWPEFGMHPLVSAGQSLWECFRASLLPLSFTNSKQFAELQTRKTCDLHIKIH